CRAAVDQLARDMGVGASRWRPRVAHLLDRQKEPPLEEIIALIPRGDPQRELVGLRYLTHLARRTREDTARRNLLDTAESYMRVPDRSLRDASLELSAALRAHELTDVILRQTRNETSIHRALIALGSIAARRDAERKIDSLFDPRSAASYRPLSIDRALPIPSWGIWPVPEEARARALDGLIEVASELVSPRGDDVADTAFAALARARTPEVLPIMRKLMDEFEIGRQLSVSTTVGGLANLGSDAGREILEDWARSGPAAVRRAAMRAVYSQAAPEETPGVGEPTELPTLALLLGRLIVGARGWPLHETDLNEILAPLCPDTATARRWMVGLGLVDRERNLYTLTETGRVLAAVESRLEDGGVRGAKRVELLRHPDLPPPNRSALG
ncbi:MAG: DUF2087 domain-containing protein, partial [Bacillota bacterium]